MQMMEKFGYKCKHKYKAVSWPWLYILKNFSLYELILIPIFTHIYTNKTVSYNRLYAQ